MSLVYPPLTSPEQTALAGASTLKWHLSVVNSTSVATAQINQSSFTFPLAQLTVNNTSANWLAVAPGMRVDIGLLPGGSDLGSYRVRLASDAVTLYIGEMSNADPGLIAPTIRGPYTMGNYITVHLNEYDLWSVSPRFLPGNIIDEDYDRAVGNANTYPEPIVNITINGDTRWGDYVDVGQTYRTVVLLATPILWVTSSSVSAYLWVIPASWTLTGGSLSSNTITCQVPASSENYIVSLAVTENNGSVAQSYRNVWAFDRGSNTPIPVTSVDSLTWDRTTMKATITLNDDGMASIPIGAMVDLWYEGTWGGSDVPTAVTHFVGWIVQRTEHTEPALRSATLDIEGVCGIMQRIGAYSQYFAAGSPANTWQTVVTTLQYVDFWLWWLIRYRAANILQLFNYQPLGISNLTGRLPQSKIPVAGSLLAQLQSLVQSYTANIGSNPDGTVLIRQHPNLLSSRGSIPIRAILAASNYSISDMTHMVFPSVRWVRGEGLYWDGAAATPTPYLSDAPGSAFGQGIRDERLQGQFVDSQDDLNNRSVLYYYLLNNALPQIDLQFKGNWSVIRPAEMSFVNFTCPANLHPSNTAINMNAIPISCALKWDNTLLVSDVDISAEGETNSVAAGMTVPGVPAPVPPPLPTMPPVPTPTLPPGHDGKSAIAVSINGKFGYTTDSGQTWTPITIAGWSGSVVDHGWFDPYSPYFTAGSGAINLYMYASDGTHTGLWYFADLLGSPTATFKAAVPSSITSIFGARIRPDVTVPGGVVVSWQGTPSQTGHITRYTDNGLTVVWDVSFPGDEAIGFDIGQFGVDEIYTGVTCFTCSPQGNYIYRFINGSSKTQVAPSYSTETDFIQVPLKNFNGGTNNLPASKSILRANSPSLAYTPDGGATWTIVNEPVPGSIYYRGGPYISSIIAGDNPNVWAFITTPFGSTSSFLCTSMDRGNTWVVSPPMLTQTALGCGYFPSKIGGNYALYYWTTSNLYASFDFGVTPNDWTGNWVSAVGATGGGWVFYSPLY